MSWSGLLMASCCLWMMTRVKCQRSQDVEWIQPQCGSDHQELREGHGKVMGLLLDQTSLHESNHLLPVIYSSPSSIYVLVFNQSGIMKAKRVLDGWTGVESWMRQMTDDTEVDVLNHQDTSVSWENSRGGAAMYALLTLAQDLPRGAPVALVTSREPSDTDLAKRAQTLLARKSIPLTVYWMGRSRSDKSLLDQVAVNTGGTVQENLNSTLNQISLLERENVRGDLSNKIEVDSSLEDLIVTIRGNITSAILIPPEGNGYHLEEQCKNGDYRMRVNINGRQKGAWYLDVRSRDSGVYNVSVEATSPQAEWATSATSNRRSDEQFNRLTQISEGIWQPFSIEVDLGSILTAVPGQRGIIYFKVRNNRNQPVYYDYTVRDKYAWVRYGNAKRSIINAYSEDRIQVDIQAPYNTAGQTQEPDIVTLTAYPPSGGSVRQSAYFRIGQMDYDSTSPSITYSYNGDCSNNLNPNKCSFGTWGANITIQDSGSGLLQISSTPVQINLDREFIAGTTNPINAMFIASCCQTKVEVTAKDTIGNKYSRIIDVEQANWTAAKISAVVLGSILLLIIIIVIILVICWRCRKSRRSLAIYPNN